MLFIPRILRTVLVNNISKYVLERIVKQEKPDFIHTNSGVIGFSSEVAQKKSIPHIWHIREFQTDSNDYPPIGGEKALRKKMYAANNHCLPITREIFNYYSLNPLKDKVLYDGVYSDSYMPDIVREKENYFLYIGALEEGKGVYDLLEAFSIYATKIPEVELWLAGRDNIDVEKYIKNNQHRKRIKYLGFRNDVYDLMKKALALIVPSFYEGFGFITAEAMINGCLVIGRNTTGTKEQFDNGLMLCGHEIGFRFDNVPELARIMHTLSVNEFEAYYEIAICAQKCAHRYTIENNIKNLIEIYNKIKNEK